MASAPEKQKKAPMYIYNMDTGNINHTSDSSANTKKPSSRGGGWGLRRSKTIREVNHPQYSGTGTNAFAGEAKTSVVVERRKSVSGSGGEARNSVSCIEVNATSVAAYLQAKVLVTDMPAFMQVHAFRCARRTFDSLDTFSSKQLACSMKKEFDKVYGPAWHCIVGSSFGSFVTHSTGCFLYFSMEKQYILVFKTKVLQIALHS